MAWGYTYRRPHDSQLQRAKAWPAPAAVITGYLAATESGADTCAATGKVIVQGSLAATESGQDTCAIVGTVEALAPSRRPPTHVYRILKQPVQRISATGRSAQRPQTSAGEATLDYSHFFAVAGASEQQIQLGEGRGEFDYSLCIDCEGHSESSPDESDGFAHQDMSRFYARRNRALALALAA